MTPASGDYAVIARRWVELNRGVNETSLIAALTELLKEQTRLVPASERELREALAARRIRYVHAEDVPQPIVMEIVFTMEQWEHVLAALAATPVQPMAASNQLACASCSTVMVADGIPGQLYCPKCQPSRSGQPSTSERDLDVCVAAVCEALNAEAVPRSGQPWRIECDPKARDYYIVLDDLNRWLYRTDRYSDAENFIARQAGSREELRERFRNLRERANGWTEADLRKHPIATLELIDALANGLIEALERIGYTVRPAAAQGKEQPQVEPIRKELMARFSNKLSMDEIANCAYALAAALQPPARLAAEQIAGIIETEVSYFNGWAVSYESMKHACLKAAKAIHAALAAHGTVPARLTAEQVREALNIERTPDLVEQITKRLNAALAAQEGVKDGDR